jgi:regulator of replication initiation timing
MTELEQLQKENAELRAENTKLRSENTSLRRQVTDLQTYRPNYVPSRHYTGDDDGYNERYDYDDRDR